MSELRCLSFLPRPVVVSILSLCVLIWTQKDVVTMPSSRFPNEEKLFVKHKTGNTYPSLSFYITSFFVVENSLQPDKLNMALGVKRLYVQILEVGSGSLLAD